jgi:hypothetical protein
VLIKLERASSDHRRQRQARESEREREKIPRGFVIKSWAVSAESVWGARVSEYVRMRESWGLPTNQSLSLSLEPSARFLLVVRIKLRCGSQAANLIPRHRSLCFSASEGARCDDANASHCHARSLFSYPLQSATCAAGGLLTHAFLHTNSTTSCGRATQCGCYCTAPPLFLSLWSLKLYIYICDEKRKNV